MSEVIKIENHVDEALANLITQYQDKPLIAALVKVLVGQVQNLEDTAWDMLTKFSLDTAQGAQLDILGEIIGESRKGKNDDAYRLAIKAKIAQNNSKATPEDIISLFKILVSANKAAYFEFFPAEAAIFADINIEDLDNNAILAFCQKAMPAGSRLDYIGWYDGDKAFGFQDDPNALEFGEAFDEAVGGVFAEVVAYKY